ncbi:hypothetical protein WSM22_27150 [Cytophagales bacterium WSM2-2]|nr:hypothetical protein WSM22_27150 [Cytophagales bacterium WSM2-2]
MIKSVHILSLVAILILAGISSCHKDDPKPSAKTELIAKTWKPTGATANGVDIFSVIDDCEKDDLMKFTKDGKVTFDQSVLKCDPNSPQTENATWSFQDGETKLRINHSDGSSETETISELSATTLKLSITDTSQGPPITIVYIFTAQ